MILQQLKAYGTLWMFDCVSEPCINAFITHHCHFSHMMSGDQRLSDLLLQADRHKVNAIQQPHEEVAQVQIGAEPLVDNSEALKDLDGHVDDRSQIDCIVGLTRDDNNSTSTGWTTEKSTAKSRGIVVAPSATSRSSRFIHRVMAAANVPTQLGDEPLCGEVSESGAEQTSDNQSISLTGHLADSSIQSGMSDVAQSVQCLGYVYHSCDSIRYFLCNSLTHTDDYLSFYDTNSCEYNDAAHEIIDTLFATRTPPVSSNKFKKRQNAKATQELEQLESVGHELNPREATGFRALSAR